MDTVQILAEVRAEIARLEKVARLLEGGKGSRRGRSTRKPLSKEAREKIAAAQRKRWAKVKGKG